MHLQVESRWSSEDSLAVLKAIVAFYRYLFVETMNADRKLLQYLLVSRTEVGEMGMLMIYEEFEAQFKEAKDLDLNLDFLGVC